MSGNKGQSGENKWTTICLSRDFKNELESQMTYGDSFESYLQSELDINED